MKLKFSLIATLVLASSWAYSDTITSPSSANDFSSTQFPFFPRSAGTSARYQQVYDARDFRSIPAEGAFITQVNFSVEFVPYGATLSNVVIHLSTTPRAPDSLSPVFASNIGIDETRVFGGPLTIEQDSSSPYRFRIRFTTPFYYNPALGNLLLDVRNYRGPLIPPFEPFYALTVDTSFGDTVSSAVALDVNSAMADGVGSAGLLTIFTTVPIPEPGAVALICLGLLGFLLWSRRSKA